MRPTTQVVRHVRQLCNNIFKECQAAAEQQLKDSGEFDKISTDKEMVSTLRVIIDDMYLNKMKALSSGDLQAILDVHNAKIIKRMPRTVEMITSELAQRALLEDN